MLYQMVSWIYYLNVNLKEVYLTDEDFVIGIVRIHYENGNKLKEIQCFEGEKNDWKKWNKNRVCSDSNFKKIIGYLWRKIFNLLIIE